MAAFNTKVLPSVYPNKQIETKNPLEKISDVSQRHKYQLSYPFELTPDSSPIGKDGISGDSQE